MKRALRWLIRLYPGQWRARYGEEFEALLEDLNPRRGDVLNVAVGALKMRIASGKFARTIAVLGVAGALMGGAIALTIPGRYLATSVGRMHQDAMPLTQQVFSRMALSSIIQDLDLYPKERQRKPLEDVIENMRARDLLMRRGPDNTVTISFAYSDPVLAQRTAARLIRRVALLNDEAHRPAFEVLDGANGPTPLAPNRLSAICTGCAVGLLLGAGIAFFRKNRRITTFTIFLGLAGTIIGFYASFAVPARYTSTGVILTPAAQDSELRISDREALAKIILKDKPLSSGAREGNHPASDRANADSRSAYNAGRGSDNRLVHLPGPVQGTTSRLRH